MAQRCQVTGKKPMVGNHVSHAHNRTKRRFMLNLQTKRIWIPELGRFVSLTLTAKALKTITKNGTAEIAEMVRANKLA